MFSFSTIFDQQEPGHPCTTNPRQLFGSDYIKDYDLHPGLMLCIKYNQLDSCICLDIYQNELFQAKAESEKREADIKIQELKEDINVRTHEAQREGRKRDKLDRELKTARLDLESKNIEIKNKQSTLQKLQEECSRLEANLKEQKV